MFHWAPLRLWAGLPNGNSMATVVFANFSSQFFVAAAAKPI